MYFLEINFLDGISPVETIFVRRPYFVIGSAENAHVLLEGTNFPYELRIFRGLGRKFYCKVVNVSKTDVSIPVALEQAYENYAELDLKEVNLKITVLDSDLIFKPDESADKAASRIVKTAFSRSAPLYPALVMNDVYPVVQSFSLEQPFIVGKSRRSDFRLEGEGIASEHLRISCIDAKLMLENLNSNYVSKINGETFSDLRQVNFGDIIELGNLLSFNIICDEKDLNKIPSLQEIAAKDIAIQTAKEQYPCIVAKNDRIYPKRIFLDNFEKIKIGRDPTSHVWINAPHVSREHLLINRENAFKIFLEDNSSNGTSLNGKQLQRQEKVELQTPALSIINLGNEYEIALCFNKEQENAYHSGNYTDLINLRSEDNLQSLQEKSEELLHFKSDEVISEQENTEISEKLEQLFASEEVVTRESPAVGEELAPKNYQAEVEPDILGKTSKLETVEPDLVQELLQKEVNNEELLVTEDFYEQEIRVQRKFKVVTLGFIVLLIGFCLMLIVGFLSDNYFY